MRSHLLLLACTLGLIAGAGATAHSQTTATPDQLAAQSKIQIHYDEPKDTELRGVYGRLKDQQVLERLQRFLAPLRFPGPLMVRTAQCGAAYRPYQPGGDVTICYEFVKQVEDWSPSALGNEVGYIGVVMVPQEAAIVGPVVEEVLHDVALAVFDRLEIPVWGRYEDAADQVAALIMLQFGTDVAQTTILGTAYFLYWSAKGADYLNADAIGDVRPPVRQRYYNILCIAYGSDPSKFSAFTAINRDAMASDLSGQRAAGCALRYARPGHEGEYEGDYEKLIAAFKTLILDPYVDPNLLKQVLAIDWLKRP